MFTYILKKLSFVFISLLIVATLTFLLMHAVPGDPFTDDKAIPEEILQAMYRHYGLDKPWYVQYGHYLKGLFTFNLGPSFKYQGRLVSDIIAEGLPVSLILGAEALLLSVCVGVALGTISSLKHLRWQDHSVMLTAVMGISVPSFILASFLQYFFAMKLNWLPVARWGTFSHSILPAICLAALPIAFIARLIRANMVEVLQSDYIQTARAKGITTFQMIWHHALRNALLPVITYLGPLTTSILTGSFAIEKIFGIPGLGQWFVNSILNRDYTLIMGLTIFYSALLMLCVFLIDLLYTVIDPRIQLTK